MGTHLLESSLDMESASSSLGVHRFSCSTIDLQYDIFFYEHSAEYVVSLCFHFFEHTTAATSTYP